MSKYTTGPWTVEFNAESECEPNIMAGDWFVAVCMDGAGDGDTQKNANLISAAPDLLEALEAMMSKAYKQNWNDNYPDQLAMAEAAVDKARGQT